MSVIAVNKAKITSNPLNTSVSKNMYSFGKADRFFQGRPFYPRISSYQTDSSGKQSKSLNPTFAKDKRVLFKLNLLGPTANKYDLSYCQSGFKKNNFTKSYSFGMGRECYKKNVNVICVSKLLDAKIPGPGSYRNSPLIGNIGLRYSFRTKNDVSTFY